MSLCVNDVAACMHSNHLQLNTAKTEVLHRAMPASNSNGYLPVCFGPRNTGYNSSVTKGFHVVLPSMFYTATSAVNNGRMVYSRERTSLGRSTSAHGNWRILQLACCLVRTGDRNLSMFENSSILFHLLCPTISELPIPLEDVEASLKDIGMCSRRTDVITLAG